VTSSLTALGTRSPRSEEIGKFTVSEKQSGQPRGSGTISTDTAVFAMSIVILFQQQPAVFLSLVQAFLNDPAQVPPHDDLMQRIEPAFKQAAELLAASQVLNGFIRHRTPQSAVTFIYIVFRYLFLLGQTPTRPQSRELWKRVWATCRNFPIVADEWQERETDGDLDDWMSEVQNGARRQLRTFKKQLPRIQSNSTDIYQRALNSLFQESK